MLQPCGPCMSPSHAGGSPRPPRRTCQLEIRLLTQVEEEVEVGDPLHKRLAGPRLQVTPQLGFACLLFFWGGAAMVHELGLGDEGVRVRG